MCCDDTDVPDQNKFYKFHFHKKAFSLSSNLIFHYPRWITPKRVTGWRGPSPRHCARATQLLSKKCRSVGVGNTVRFDQPENWSSDLSLQRRSRYRSANWLNKFSVLVLKLWMQQKHFFPVMHASFARLAVYNDERLSKCGGIFLPSDVQLRLWLKIFKFNLSSFVVQFHKIFIR